MALDVLGKVITGDRGRPIHGATVGLVAADGECSERPVRTNRRGEFHLRSEQGGRADAAELRLRASDGRGRVLADRGVRLLADGVRTIDLAVDPDVLAAADLPAQCRDEALIDPAVFDRIEAAIGIAAEPGDRDGHRACVRRIRERLPPLLSSTEALDLARGVLRGRVDEMRRLGEQLDLWEALGADGGCAARGLSRAEAEEILDPVFLRSLAAQPAGERAVRRASVVPRARSLPLIAAAMRVAGGDPLAINRNLGLVMNQLCPAEWIAVLDERARGVIGGLEPGGPLLELVGGLGGADGPLPIGAWGRVFLPCPGQGIWPPEPGESGLGGLGGIDPCEGDHIRDARDLLAREMTYAIDGIDPPDACPGQKITIRGSNFDFEGNTGVVNFSGLRRGTVVTAEPETWTDDEIVVEVPDGAYCGPIELDVPFAATVVSCDTSVDLFKGPSEPVVFAGGETAIRSFDRVGSGCVAPGEAIELTWFICNATSAHLRIADEAGRVELEESLDPASRGHVHTPPLREGSRRLVATLSVTGSCGADERSVEIGVRGSGPLTLERIVPFPDHRFENFFGNVSAARARIAVPRSLDELVRAVQTAEMFGHRLGVTGSRCSYTKCVLPDEQRPLVLDLGHLDRLLNVDRDELPLRWSSERAVGPERVDPRTSQAAAVDEESKGPREYLTPGGTEPVFDLAEGLRDEIGSALSDGARREYEAATGRPIGPVAERLVHVEAGIKVAELNALLDHLSPRLALATMGAGTHQSISGAFSTGTHGGTAKLPPLADFVRAIHLVGPGGRQWWLEPRSNPITDQAQMEAIRRRPGSGIDPCIEIRYEDDLFYAALVAAGCAGAIYSVVLEAVPAHRMRSTTTGKGWDRAAAELSTTVIEAEEGAHHWFTQAAVNPSGACRVTQKDLTDAVEDAIEDDRKSLGEEILIALFGVPTAIGLGAGAVGALFGAVPAYIARRQAEISLLFLQPWNLDRIAELREEIDTLGDLGDATRALLQVVVGGADDEDLARALPELLNLFWRIGLYIDNGREIVDAIQNVITRVKQLPDEDGVVARSFTSLTVGEQLPGAPPYPPRDERYDPFERLFHSWEFALPAARGLAFVDALLAAAGEIRKGRDALVLNLNVRFTQRTHALLGMQQFPSTCHVEVFTITGLNGNRAFYSAVETLAREHQALPHWGQTHSPEMDFPDLFGPADLGGLSKLRRWQRALNEIAAGDDGDPNLFRSSFALDRGLLDEL